MSVFKDARSLTTAAMLLGLSIILSLFRIPISSIVEIRFSVIPLAAAGYLLGPAAGGIIGALADILGHIVRPTGPFFPGFTVSGVVTGLIFGLLLYRKRLSLPRILIACLINSVIVNMLLNSIWLSILYGNGFAFVFASRIIKNIVTYPMDVVLVYAVLRVVSRFAPGFWGRKKPELQIAPAEKTETDTVSGQDRSD